MFLVLLLGVLLAWLLCRLLYQKYWYRGLSVEISFQDRFLYEGETSSLKEVVTNDKLLPLPALEVRFSSNRSLEFLNDASVNTSSTDLSYKRDVFSFLFHQRTERTLPFAAHKRGFYQIYEVSLTGYDFFFRSGYYADIHQQTLLYVYPRQVDTGRISLLCQAVSGMMISRSRLYPDPFEFSGIRDYRKEDPMNHINWKASARSGNLMVNQFDSTTDISLTVIFDTEDSQILKYEDLTEETIRIASSLCLRLVKMHLSFHIRGNALDQDSGRPLSMYFGAGAGNMEELNQKLACIDTSRTALTAADLLKDELSLKKKDHTYVFISKNTGSGLEELVSRLTAGSSQLLWVLPFRPADRSSLTLPSFPRMSVIPWESEQL